MIVQVFVFVANGLIMQTHCLYLHMNTKIAVFLIFPLPQYHQAVVGLHS